MTGFGVSRHSSAAAERLELVVYYHLPHGVASRQHSRRARRFAWSVKPAFHSDGELWRLLGREVTDRFGLRGAMESQPSLSYLRNTEARG
jgi:hypothetical protein